VAVKTNQDEMWAGNKRVLRYTITDEDTSGSPAKDLTGYTAKWAISRFSADGSTFNTAPVLEKSSGSGITITDAANGILEVTIDTGDTSALSGVFYMELELFDSSSNPVVVATGKMTIIRNVVNA